MDKMKKGGLYDGAGSEWDETEHPRDEDGKFVAVSEFRYLEKHADPKQHPAHLYARKKDEVKFHQLTHSEQIKGKKTKNIPLSKNPNPRDSEQSYFVPNSRNGKDSDFRKMKKDWSLSEEDDELMKPYRDEPFDN